MKFRHTWRIVALVLTVGALLTLGGCASERTQWDAPAPKNPVLVLMTIDVSEARRPNEFEMERLKPEPGQVSSKFWWYKFNDDQYVLVHEDLSAGQYRVNTLGVDVGPAIVRFDAKDDPRFHRTFSKSGVYFLGAYKFHVIYPQNRIGKMRFELQSAEGPGEREAIERVLVAEHVKDQYWKDLLNKRLKQLSK